MKIAFVILVAILISVNSLPLEFNSGGWSGVINSIGTVNGVENKNNEEMNSKAEEAIKGMIEKYLAGKKKSRNPQKVQVQSPVSDLKDINWDEHSEVRDLINEKVPGGVASVDALIKLFRETPAN